MTTSFQRRGPVSKHLIPGTKLDGQELLISTGIATLDECIGGGIAVGSVLLIEEDTGGFYSPLISKYFIAEGICHDHEIICYPNEVPSNVLLKNIPSSVEKEKPKAQSNTSSNEPLKIAWRYQNVPSAALLSGTLTRHFDWNQPVSNDKLSRIICHEDRTYSGMLEHLSCTVSSQDFSKKVLRLVIHDIGSLLWEDADKVYKTLYAVRCFCRSYNATCLMTTSSYWMRKESGRANRVRQLVDIAFELHTLQESEKVQRPHLKDLDGVIYFHRIQRPNTYFTRTVSNNRDLAFSVKRKVFNIEKIHLPPALGESPAIKTTPRSMCSSRPGTSSLEF